MTFTEGEGGSWTKPFVVVDGSASGWPWVLARDAWPLDDLLWESMEIEPGGIREVDG